MIKPSVTALSLTILFAAQSTHAADLSLFDRAAALGFGVATRSAEKAVELDTEKQAQADPDHANQIRQNAAASLNLLHKSGNSLFNAAGFDVGSHEQQLAEIQQPGAPNIEVGIYGQMLQANNLDSDTAIYSIPTTAWLTSNGYNVNDAVAVRIPKAAASKMIANETGQSFKAVVINDIKNLRDGLLASGANADLTKNKIVQLVNLSNNVYANQLVKAK